MSPGGLKLYSNRRPAQMQNTHESTLGTFQLHKHRSRTSHEILHGKRQQKMTRSLRRGNLQSRRNSWSHSASNILLISESAVSSIDDLRRVSEKTGYAVRFHLLLLVRNEHTCLLLHPCSVPAATSSSCTSTRAPSETDSDRTVSVVAEHMRRLRAQWWAVHGSSPMGVFIVCACIFPYGSSPDMLNWPHAPPVYGLRRPG